MKADLRAYLGGLLACLILWPVLSFAQLSDHAQNLAACKAGRGVCDHSKLTQTELAEVIASDHGRNVADCRGGSGILQSFKTKRSRSGRIGRRLSPA